MKKTIFTGAGVAIVTPFTADNKINYDKLAELIVGLSLYLKLAYPNKAKKDADETDKSQCAHHRYHSDEKLFA